MGVAGRGVWCVDVPMRRCACNGIRGWPSGFVAGELAISPQYGGSWGEILICAKSPAAGGFGAW